jgi:hypothetical protein
MLTNGRGNTMKVSNMTSSSGNKVANQFVIDDSYGNTYRKVFQSYDSVIVVIEANLNIPNTERVTKLDRDTWDYSVTTGKYRNQFLGETKKETQAKIDSGEYILTDLN